MGDVQSPWPRTHACAHTAVLQSSPLYPSSHLQSLGATQLPFPITHPCVQIGVEQRWSPQPGSQSQCSNWVVLQLPCTHPGTPGASGEGHLGTLPNGDSQHTVSIVVVVEKVEQSEQSNNPTQIQKHNACVDLPVHVTRYFEHLNRCSQTSTINMSHCFTYLHVAPCHPLSQSHTGLVPSNVLQVPCWHPLGQYNVSHAAPSQP